MSELSFDRAQLIEKYGSPDFAMAYGSGVFEQDGYTESDRPMIDFVFGAEESQAWHRANLEENKGDYSLLSRTLGPKIVTSLQQSGAGVYYNPFVDFSDKQGTRKIKYGVISTADLVRDLRDWETLYVSGRLHKPVEILSTTGEIQSAMEANYKSALEVALLLLPENFTDEDIYMAIAGISYMGDSRMRYAENPQKVKNIVNKNIEGFASLYARLIASHTSVATLANNRFQQDTGPQNLNDRVATLPSGLRARMPKKDVRTEISLPEVIRNSVSATVSSSSVTQTIKGFISSGPINSAKYAQAKIKKAQKQ